MQEGLSIVICCYNSADKLPPTLKAIQKQEGLSGIHWEVIIVNNNCSDSTVERANQLWSANPVTNLVIVDEIVPGLMNARKTGIRKAQFSLVAMVDDDNILERDWICKAITFMNQHPEVGALGGRSVPIFEQDEPEWFPMFSRKFAVGHQHRESGPLQGIGGVLWGAGFVFRKSIWDQLEQRQFVNLTEDRRKNELTSGGDTELSYAIRLLGYQLFYWDELCFQHYMPQSRLTLSHVKKLNEGFGRSNVLLNLYRQILKPNEFKTYHWTREWFHAKQRMAHHLVVSLFGNNRKKWFYMSRYYYWKGYSAQTWKDRNRLQQIRSQIETTFLPILPVSH